MGGAIGHGKIVWMARPVVCHSRVFKDLKIKSIDDKM
jgi:hypothetical protein